jgi:hypothetical protein
MLNKIPNRKIAIDETKFISMIGEPEESKKPTLVMNQENIINKIVLLRFFSFLALDIAIEGLSKISLTLSNKTPNRNI